MRSLNNRFHDFSFVYVPFRARRSLTNEVALDLINAMKVQAIQDCEQHMTSYIFTDSEYGDSEIRIRINAAQGALQAQLVRCSILYAIKTLAISQLTRERLYGATFIESYRGQPLYTGVLDNKSDDPSLERSSNSSADSSETVKQERRALRTLVLDATNSTTTLLSIPGSNDVEYQIEFDFRGDRIPKIGIFSAILEFMMTLAERNSDDSIQNISQATSVDSIWIFVTRDARSRFPLQVFQLVAILESVARYAVVKKRYQEMTFKFFVNREIVAEGCLTAPISSRVWCQALR